MIRILFNPDKRFAFALNTAFKFVLGGILWIVFADPAVFNFNSTAIDHVPVVHPEVLERIAFVTILGIFFFVILQRALNSRKEISEHEFFRKNSQPMWIFDAQTLRFLDVNDAAVSMYGYSIREFLSMTVNDILSVENKLDEKSRLLQNGHHYQGVKKQFRKDGSFLHGEIMYYPVRYGKQHAGLLISNDVTRAVQLEEELKNVNLVRGKDPAKKCSELVLLNKELQLRNRDINANNDELIAINSLLVDVTKRTSSQLSLMVRDKTQQLTRLLNDIRDCTWSFDLTGKDENYVSRSASRFFGLTEAEIVDRPNFWMEYIHPEDMPIVNEKLNELQQNAHAAFTYRISIGQPNPAYIHQKVNLVHNHEGNAVRLEYHITEANVFEIVYR